ncbi:MAG: ChaN family lipoprotein [Vulcanococcus sp.]
MPALVVLQLAGALVVGLPAGQPAAQATPAPAACAAAQQAHATQRRQALNPQLQVVLLGELHDDPADHAWQLQTLQALKAAGRPLSLGLEMVPAPRQPVFDRWNSGQLDMTNLLLQVGWQEVWGHDPRLYLPLLAWARQQGVPLLALNAEPSLVRRVNREGLAAIPRQQRGGIGLPAPAGAAYRQRLEQSWRGHSGHTSGPLAPAQAAALQRFIDSQLLRDRAMAEQIAAARQRDPQRLVVALIGRGHLENGDGVPAQLRALGSTRVLPLIRGDQPAACLPIPTGARLGAYLESDSGGVWVRQVAPGSAAAAADLRPGDRILAVNGVAVERAGQVIRAMRLHPDGSPLQLTLLRHGRRLTLELELPPRTEPALASGDNAPSPSPAPSSPA